MAHQPIEVPAATLIALRIGSTLSSDETLPGTLFEGLVTQETSIEGRVVVPLGSVVHGRVLKARSGEFGDRALLSLAFDRLQTPAGDPVGISARLAPGGTSWVGRDAVIVRENTFGGGEDGPGEGLRGADRPVVLPAGTRLTIELRRPITVAGPAVG